MFISADTMAYLLGLGLDPIQLTELVRRLDDDAKAMQPVKPTVPVDSVAERKRAADRERMREKRERESVARQSRDVACDNSDISLSLPLSPQTPQTPTHTHGDITTRAKRATRRVPESWVPSMAVMEFAVTEGFSSGEIERELATMRDHTFGTARSDWDATFRNWLRRKKPTPSPRQNHERPSRQAAQLDERYDNYRRALAGAESAVERGAVESSGGF